MQGGTDPYTATLPEVLDNFARRHEAKMAAEVGAAKSGRLQRAGQGAGASRREWPARAGSPCVDGLTGRGRSGRHAETRLFKGIPAARDARHASSRGVTGRGGAVNKAGGGGGAGGAGVLLTWGLAPAASHAAFDGPCVLACSGCPLL